MVVYPAGIRLANPEGGAGQGKEAAFVFWGIEINGGYAAGGSDRKTRIFNIVNKVQGGQENIVFRQDKSFFVNFLVSAVRIKPGPIKIASDS